MSKKLFAYVLPGILVAAGVIRFLLFLANPPGNAFDNHFEPVLLILQTRVVPPLNACWECYQPPVFYLASAMAGKFAIVFGMAPVLLPKLLQFLSFLCGILHLAFILMILKKLPLSGFARAVAFSFACFLPAHIYISAMFSNDTASYLAVALCVYIFLIAAEKKLPLRWLIYLGVAVTIAAFTKYTSLAIIPAIAGALVAMRIKREIDSNKRLMTSLAAIFAIPLFCLSIYCAWNAVAYGALLPSNHRIENPGQVQPKAENVEFLDFRPWAAAKDVVLKPGLLGSFWTQIYARSWFDLEPKFLYFTDPDNDWWNSYYYWMRGEAPFPARAMGFSWFTRFTAMGLITLGLVPLFLLLAGVTRAAAFSGKTLLFPVLSAASLAIVIALTMQSPVYSSMKSIYLLSSLPAFAMLAALGVMRFEKYASARLAIGAIAALLPVLVIAHILHIVWTAGFFNL